jgi:hypothetical protein
MPMGRPSRAGLASLFAFALASGVGAVSAADAAKVGVPANPMERVEGAWTYAGQDCDTDNHFEPPAGMPGAAFTLARDHTYTLTMSGQKPRGTFRLKPYAGDYLEGEWWIVVLEQAQLTFILNVDRLESWSEEPVAQCTQLFERPK